MRKLLSMSIKGHVIFITYQCKRYLPLYAYVRHTEAVKRIATAYLKLLFPNVRTASDVNPKEFMKYCLRPAIKMRKIIWRQLSILDAEYKNDDKLMPEFTLKEISNEA